MNTAVASTKGVHVSTRKVRLVADVIRDMKATQAVATLGMLNKHGASVLMKTLKSAIANAVNNGKMVEDNLKIEKLEVLEGPFLKRFRASTRGRIHSFKKRSTHITIVLSEGENK